jgi:thioesterase domain-containing protein/non-ribosomal peptide synthetase component F
MTGLHEAAELSEGANAPSAGSESQAAEYFVFPLSPQQQSFWRGDQSIPGNAAYNGAFRHELTGPLDAGLWERAWNELVQRHEALRACVRVIDGKGVLAIAETLPLRLVGRDLRRLPADRRAAEIERLCAQDARHSFDLANGPLIRVGLIRDTDDRFVQTLTLHHLVCDGWSIGLLMDELPEIYTALVEGRPARLPDLAIQFGDYLAWLEQRLADPEIVAQCSYWTARLAGYRRVDVAPDLERPAGPCLASDIVSQALPSELVGKLKAFADEQGGTLFITGLTAVMALLQRETERGDLGVGLPVAGRNRPEVEKLVGPLLNHVLVRIRADEQMTLRTLESAVREAVLEAFANQDVPLEHVEAALAREGMEVPDPFYSVSFVSQRAFAGGRNLTARCGGVDLRTLPSKSQGALYDLFFFLVEREDGWRLSLDYRTELYSTARANALLAGLISILERIAERPDERLGALEAARALAPVPEVAGNGNTEGVDEPLDQYILPVSFLQERFWLLSRAAPDSTAFNMPAALRISGPLDATLLETGLRRMIARHEILRTGFSEVDGKVCQVIVPELPFDLAVTDLPLGSSDDHEERLREAVRREGGIAFDLAAPPLMRAHLFRMAPTDHLLVLTLHDIVSDAQSLALLQRELWATYEALSEGRAPELPELALQYGDFAAWQHDWVESDVAKAKLDFWKRSLAGRLPVLDFPLDRAPSHGSQTGIGLEALPLGKDLVGNLKRLAQSQNATMFALTGAAFAALLARYARQGDILFGSPVANRSTDTEAMLGRFAGPMALRLDLSDDPTLVQLLGRTRDATYEALENADYPFELLLDHVDARSVGGRNPLFQFYFLYQVAFLQEQRTKTLDIIPMPSLGVGTTFELQLALIERPTGVTAQLEYNPALLDATTARGVLSYYGHVLEALASDPSQELSALAEPDVAPESRARMGVAKARPAYVAPGSDAERRLAAIWERFLRQSPIGVDDDFFQLGGQSILAARVITAIEKEFGVRTSISILAYARTIRQMVEAIAGQDKHAPALVVPMKQGREGEAIYLVHCGGGHVLRYQNFVNAIPEDMPVYGITAPPIDEIADTTSVEELARRYVSEMRKVQPSGPYRLGGYSFGGLVAYEMAAQLTAAGQQVAVLAIFDTANPSFYRALPRPLRWKMHAIHLAHVVDGYVRLLAAGNFERIASRIKDTCENYSRKARSKMRRLLGRVSDAPVRKSIEDFLSEFTIIASRYVPPPLPASAVLFYAEQRGWEYRGNPTLGWDKLVRDGVTVRYVPGDHESLMQPPNAGVLARTFVDAVREVSDQAARGKLP